MLLVIATLSQSTQADLRKVLPERLPAAPAWRLLAVSIECRESGGGPDKSGLARRKGGESVG